MSHLATASNRLADASPRADLSRQFMAPVAKPIGGGMTQVRSQGQRSCSSGEKWSGPSGLELPRGETRASLKLMKAPGGVPTTRTRTSNGLISVPTCSPWWTGWRWTIGYRRHYVAVADGSTRAGLMRKLREDVDPRVRDLKVTSTRTRARCTSTFSAAGTATPCRSTCGRRRMEPGPPSIGPSASTELTASSGTASAGGAFQPARSISAFRG